MEMGKRALAIACLWMLLALLWVTPFAFAATCGNDSCEEGENKCTCPDDCGQCTGSYAGNSCQQFTCVNEVCIPLLKLGCCGNGICESNEAYASCPNDCFPRSVAVDVLEYPDGNILRGQIVIIRAKVLADLYPATDADVKAKSPGFLGTLSLYDDGDHNDLEADDGIYGNATAIGTDALEGPHRAEIEAFVRTVRGETEFTSTVVPYLTLLASLDAEAYALGDTIQISGSLARLGAPFLAPVTLELLLGDKVFHTTVLNPDDEGGFTYERRTSLLDAPGNWLLRLTAADTSNNRGVFEKTLHVASEKGAGFLRAEFLEPTQRAYDRGTEIPFLIRVFDQYNQAMEGGEVELLFPDKEKMKTEELSPGNYGAKYLLPVDFPVGEQPFTARASKDVNAVRYSGTAVRDLVINRIPLSIELVSPTKEIYDLGEKIEFTIKAYYAFNRPLEHGTVLLDFGNRIIGAQEELDGAYHYSMTVTEKGVKFIDIKIKASDAYGNTASKSVSLKIRQNYSLPYTISQNPAQFGGATVALLCILLLVGYVASNAARLRLEDGNKKRLLDSKKKVQDQYFNERLLGNREYLQLAEKINAELDQVEARIMALKQASLGDKLLRLLPRKKE